MVTLCAIPSAIDLQQLTIVAMGKSIQNNNNPFNKPAKLMFDNMLQYPHHIGQQSIDYVNNNNNSNVNHNELSANNIPNAEQQQLQLIPVVLADPIHHAPTALSISGKQLMD